MPQRKVTLTTSNTTATLTIIHPGSMNVDTHDTNAANVARTTTALAETMDEARRLYTDDEHNTGR